MRFGYTAIMNENHRLRNSSQIAQYSLSQIAPEFSDKPSPTRTISQSSVNRSNCYLHIILIDLTNRKHHFSIWQNVKFLIDFLSLIDTLGDKIACLRINLGHRIFHTAQIKLFDFLQCGGCQTVTENSITPHFINRLCQCFRCAVGN